MTVELRHLRCFLAVATERNFTRAAASLHLSQPALSRTLAQLEARLGAALVDRSTHHVQLTDAGATFVAPARAAVRAFDTAVASAAASHPALRVGVSWSTAAHSAAMVRAWRAAEPSRPVEVQRRDDRLGGLPTHEVDVALVRGPIDEPGLRTALVEDEARYVVLPHRHRLAAEASLRLRDLSGEAVVLGTAIGTTTLDLWPRGRRPRIAAEVATLDDWLVTIAAGTGFGVTPASTRVLHSHPDVVYVPLIDAPTVPLLLAWPARRAHPDARRFVATALAAAAR